MTSFNLRMLPDGARVKFSRIEQLADKFRHDQSFAHGRATEIRRVFSMNASLDPAERRQLEVELRDHDETLKNASDNHRAAAAVHATVRAWVEKITATPPSRPLEDAPKVKPPLQKGEGLKYCLDRLRKEIITVKNAKYTTALAPLPARDLREHAREYVERMAKSAKPHPQILADGTFSVSWFGGSIPTALSAPAAFAICCAVDPERAKACLAEAIDTQPKPSGVEAMSAFDKDQRLKELDAQLDLLERQEEATIQALHAEGSTIARRHDPSPPSPMALLGIQFVRPSSLKQVPRKATNGNGAADDPPKRKKRGLVRVKPKHREDRAARH